MEDHIEKILLLIDDPQNEFEQQKKDLKNIILTKCNELKADIINLKRKREIKEDDLQLWAKNYHLLKDTEIIFEQNGFVQDAATCQYCHCKRGTECDEYDTHYECYIIIKKDLLTVFELNIIIDQEMDMSSNKVYFEEPEETFHEQFIDWNYFGSFECINGIMKDFFEQFCNYKDLCIKV